MSAPTAILFFSRTASAEARAKAFGPRGERVAAALIRRTERTLARTGLPVYRSNERQQLHDQDFGGKLSAAVTDVFARGHVHVIVVSNDCPRLSVAAIRRATRALEAGRHVIGPDTRGGAWLIGLRADTFDPAAFAALNWQSDAVAEELLMHLQDCTQLTCRTDYNNFKELRIDWYQLTPHLPTLAFLFRLPSAFAPAYAPLPSSPACPTPELRGPPTAP
ncbi:DUF2064 domain-containing protein [Neolewinella sp.]|uniref:DUF2064 domain-containing protein n=1 Tax=Neolewinella sp. TaxID=2993543 RepID=UPI003B515603